MTDRAVFVIGAGAVGGSLAVALANCKRPLVGVFDPDEDRVRKVAEAAGTNWYCGELPKEINSAQTVLVAVPDSQIPKISKRAVDMGLGAASQSWLHTAGALSSEALKEIGMLVGGIGALHPALVFAPDEITTISKNASFAFEGDEVALKAATSIVKDLSCQIVKVPAEARPMYHAATVLGSNAVMGLLGEAVELLVKAGLPATEVEKLLVDLTHSAVTQAQKIGIVSALSGPIRRGDSDAVARHLSALNGSPDLLEIYKVLGLSVVRLTQKTQQARSADLERIKKLLKE
jgi:predicted short-subunit dehydrogenase-like oxidoreductase (DUF2520 family)